MKNILITIFSIFLLSSCTSDDYFEESPYLPYAPVNIDINLNDPYFSVLKEYEGAVFIDDGYSGVLGVIIFNSGAGYRAYEAACPNHAVRDCSTLEFDYNLVYCVCEDVDFSLHTGKALNGRGFRLREYRVQTYKNTLSIVN